VINIIRKEYQEKKEKFEKMVRNKMLGKYDKEELMNKIETSQAEVQENEYLESYAL
jgi:hypothetical protein